MKVIPGKRKSKRPSRFIRARRSTPGKGVGRKETRLTSRLGLR